ncbi:MAG: hypothetical protein GQ564_08225 [Bacteroidales bacterium]|nr:hypothetical protein [Bacteroidales bacterium]
MKIKDYIKELLFTNQGVVIPGLGGFVSEYESAAFDVNENSFIPPSKKITFNPKYSYHDNLLIEFISEKENIDKEKSIKNLEDFVKDIKTRLIKGEKIDFPEIGSLSQNVNEEILFEQDTTSNLLSDSFGLTSVKTKLIVNPQNNVAKAVKPVKQKKSYKKLIFISSSAIVFLCLLTLSWFLTEGYTDFSLISSNEKPNPESSNNIIINTPEKNLDSIAQADSVKALINQSIDENTDKKDALFYTEPEKEAPKPKYSEFHIIAGSFKKIENAEVFSSKLRDKGYEPVIIRSGENLIRIAIFSYTDETEALTKLYSLRESSNIKSVWILKSI